VFIGGDEWLYLRRFRETAVIEELGYQGRKVGCGSQVFIRSGWPNIPAIMIQAYLSRVLSEAQH